jgi:hypothetical protein
MCVHADLDSIFVTDGNVADILPFLTLPCVKTLSVRLNGGESHDHMTNFIPFLSRSAATLREFTVGILSSAIPVHWFSITAHLTNLEICGLTQDPDFAAPLNHVLNRSTHLAFLPKLERLRYSDVGWPELLDMRLLSALSSRCSELRPTGHSNLRSFRLIWASWAGRSHPPPLLAGFRALAACGLNIHIGTENQNTLS